MAARKITDEMIDRIATWDLQGWSLRDMAAELPVSKEVVRRNLLKDGDELKQAMSLGVFRSRLLPDQPRGGE